MSANHEQQTQLVIDIPTAHLGGHLDSLQGQVVQLMHTNFIPPVQRGSSPGHHSALVQHGGRFFSISCDYLRVRLAPPTDIVTPDGA